MCSPALLPNSMNLSVTQKIWLCFGSELCKRLFISLPFSNRFVNVNIFYSDEVSRMIQSAVKQYTISQDKHQNQIYSRIFFKKISTALPQCVKATSQQGTKISFLQSKGNFIFKNQLYFFSMFTGLFFFVVHPSAMVMSFVVCLYSFILETNADTFCPEE